MRKILFRGKRVDTLEWIQGTLYNMSNNHNPFIMLEDRFGCSYPVLRETVGQFTGLTDADGIPIFEGDMFEPYDDEFDKSVVEFRNGAFRVVTYGITGAMMPYGWDETAGGYGELDEHDLIDWVDCGVIGNIHDNPELMEEAR